MKSSCMADSCKVMKPRPALWGPKYPTVCVTFGCECNVLDLQAGRGCLCVFLKYA